MFFEGDETPADRSMDEVFAFAPFEKYRAWLPSNKPIMSLRNTTQRSYNDAYLLMCLPVM